MSRYKINPFWFFILLMATIYAIWFYNQRKNAKLVRENYELAIGKLSRYGSIGTMKSYKITYSYKVDKVIYSRQSSAPYKIFPNCEHDFGLCSDKRFWVAYEKDDPSNSLINLDIEIQDIENPVPPETLEGFR